MIIFGVDIPLIEIIIALGIIQILVLVEAAVVIILLIKHMNQSKKQSELMNNLSKTLVEIKRLEIKELDKLRKK
ncbi:hypothetical protein HOI26_02880 [Candidatus Woesearchaeota archaeon]|nr:hypothetical protein [Candidatus Woesearchaeota archaeon]MBT5740022.1 hypothetical protein [Candidatus Woesearchaeota archaeon]